MAYGAIQAEHLPVKESHALHKGVTSLQDAHTPVLVLYVEAGQGVSHTPVLVFYVEAGQGLHY
jgi:hypothetical protein